MLVAVFVPITLLEGDLGKLFSEFAVAMTVAVVFSTLVALTLAPVICSRLLTNESTHNRLADFVDGLTGALEQRYRSLLQSALRRPVVTVVILIGSIVLSGWLFNQVPQEYAPNEDRGILFMVVQSPEGSSFDYTVRQLSMVEERLMPLVESGEIKRLLIRAPSWGAGESFNSAFSILVLSPWDSGRRGTAEILADARQRVSDIPGARIFIRSQRALGGGSNPPVQFFIGGNTYEDLDEWQSQLMQAVSMEPMFVGADTDFKPTKPQLRVRIDRDRAGDLGVNLLDVSRTLETLMGNRKVTTFVLAGKEYDVIVEGDRAEQGSLSDLGNIYVRSGVSGELIPLNNLVTLKDQADAGQLNRYNRVRGITLTSNLAEGVSLGEALAWLESWVQENLPNEASVDYKGESLEYKEAGRSVAFIFSLALLVVFLVMAAQFESYVHPFVILLTVPLALVGGLGGLLLFGQTLNIFSQVGLVMLVGLATKNGILIVEFINQLRDAGRDFDEAIINGAAFRLRPILMTGFTTVFGAVPLVLSTGPGYESRMVIGIVVMCGVTVASLITLLAVPVAYKLLAKNTHAPGTVAKTLEKELAGT